MNEHYRADPLTGCGLMIIAAFVLLVLILIAVIVFVFLGVQL